MLLEKLSQGVLRLLTPLGPRFVKPPFVQRVYLLWIFRNFRTLPANVLSQSQQRRIQTICQRYGYVSQFGPNQGEEFAVLGTLEQRPAPQETLAPRRPPASVRGTVPPFAADAQRQS